MAERKGRRKDIEARGRTDIESIGHTASERARYNSDQRSATTPEERHHLISKAAYFRAERRGFQPGSELEDWLQAEAEVDGEVLNTAQRSQSPEV